jgi:hypothetical protein
LRLAPKQGDGEELTVPMELTLPQFYAFLHELEKAKAALESA